MIYSRNSRLADLRNSEMTIFISHMGTNHIEFRAALREYPSDIGSPWHLNRQQNFVSWIYHPMSFQLREKIGEI